MTDGIFLLDDEGFRRRPKSKKEIRERAKSHPEQVLVESTSIFADAGTTPISELSRKVTFVGPDPYKDRKFYGTIHPSGKVE